MAAPAPFAAAVADEPEHVHHPNADSSVEFKGFAAYEKKGDVKVRRNKASATATTRAGDH